MKDLGDYTISTYSGCRIRSSYWREDIISDTIGHSRRTNRNWIDHDLHGLMERGQMDYSDLQVYGKE